MPYFNYTIRDANGQTRSGKVEAPNAEELRKRLQAEGLQVIEITEDRKAPRVPAGGYGRVKLSDLAIFARQFSTMLDAGVSLIRCLDVLQAQTSNARLRKILMDLSARVESGESLSRSMARHPKGVQPADYRSNSRGRGRRRAGRVAPAHLGASSKKMWSCAAKSAPQ
jgi:type IV pilus assembly protein PilC